MPFSAPEPFVNTANGVYLVGPEDCPYTTVGDANTDASSGDTICVMPGTYAENITAVDGVSYVAMGPVTLGTGAGPAVTIASPSGDESAVFSGPWTIAATASISAAAGAYLVLSDDVDVTGTISGIYRRGRSWVLQSGEVLATYLPADASVISDIRYGDRLHDGNTARWLSARTCDGALEWCTDWQVSLHLDSGSVYYGTNSGTADVDPPLDADYDHVYIEGAHGWMDLTTPDAATDYMDWQYQMGGAGLHTAYSTQNQAAGLQRADQSIDTIIDTSTYIGTSGGNRAGLEFTETGSITFYRHLVNLWWCGVAR